VIAGEVVNRHAFGDKFKDAPHYFHVRLGPVRFAELPDIDDIAVEDNNFRSDTFEVLQQFSGVAAIGTQVYIRDNQYINFALCHLPAIKHTALSQAAACSNKYKAN
jgi:hypothetical protein